MVNQYFNRHTLGAPTTEKRSISIGERPVNCAECTLRLDPKGCAKSSCPLKKEIHRKEETK